MKTTLYVVYVLLVAFFAGGMIFATKHALKYGYSAGKLKPIFIVIDVIAAILVIYSLIILIGLDI